jgi:hypothetical protein
MRECETERTNREATLTLTGTRMVPHEQVRQKQRKLRDACVRGGLAMLASTALCLPSARLLAQPAAEPEAKPVVGAPAAPQPEVAATAPSAQPAVAAPAPVEAPPPPPPPASNMPTLKIGLGVRTGLSIGNVNPKGSADGDGYSVQLQDGLFDGATLRPYFSSQLTKHIGVVANLDIQMTRGFNLLDAIAQFKIVDEFQIWVGQHIPANDRNNFCGPFFANTWNFAVNVQAYPMDFAARDRGMTFWGLVAGGILKYQASVVDLQPGAKIENARYAGRLTLNLLDPENYYYSSGTYFGSQDVLSLGAVFSYQKGLDVTQTTTGANGMDVTNILTDNDFIGFSFDALFEKRLGKAGTLTLEAGYWNFDNSGTQYIVNQNSKSLGNGFVSGLGQSVLAAVSWLTPGKIGIGHLQPNVKFQWADKKTSGGVGSPYDTKVVDLGLGYIIDGYNHHWRANYRFGNTPAGVENSFQLGIQFQI